MTLDELEQLLKKATPGPWLAANMVHADRRDAMTADELGAYVAANVRRSIEDGGSADRFLFLTTNEDDAPDICHVGNGPNGPTNAALIAALRNEAPRLLAAAREVERMREALREMVERWEPPEEDGQDRRMWEAARAALKETQT